MIRLIAVFFLSMSTLLFADEKADIQSTISDQLRAFASDNFIVTCLRFSTACGYSDRLRLDLVLNDFVSSVFLNNEIRLLSDGQSWRPLIHVKDMARAIEWASFRENNQGGAFLSINVGSKNWNYKDEDFGGSLARQSKMKGSRKKIFAFSEHRLGLFKMETQASRIHESD